MNLERREQSQKIKNNFFAEIVESSLNYFSAQCWQWDNFPTFGSLVEVNSKERKVFGIVANISTGSLDSTRSSFPYQKTEEELKAEQPQIFEFLKTVFKVLVVGYSENNSKILYLLPPNPCKIHSFISVSSKDSIENFFSSNDFLHLIFSTDNNSIRIDELLLAILLNLSKLGILTNEGLMNFCDRLSLLKGFDYRWLKLFISRIETLL